MGSGQFTTQVSRNMRSSVVLSSRYLLSRGTSFLICFHDIRFDCLEYTSNNTRSHISNKLWLYLLCCLCCRWRLLFSSLWLGRGSGPPRPGAAGGGGRGGGRGRHGDAQRVADGLGELSCGAQHLAVTSITSMSKLRHIRHGYLSHACPCYKVLVPHLRHYLRVSV